jgi:hypothetical protein
MQRSTGWPRRTAATAWPRPLGAPPPPPPEPPPPGGQDGTGDDHGDSHGSDPEIVGMAAAHGWEARYSGGELPVLAWVLEEWICAAEHIHRRTFGLVMTTGSVDGPSYHVYFEGTEEALLGEFLGFFPV